MTGGGFPELSVQSFAACEVGAGKRLIGAPIDTDSIYLVLAGKMHLSLAGGDSIVGAGSLVLLPAGLQPGIAPGPTADVEVVATRERLAQRGGMLVFDIADGKAGALRVLVGRVRGDLFATLRPGGDMVPLAGDLRGVTLAKSAYATLLAELDEPSPGFATLAATLMKACLLLFIRMIRDGQESGVAPNAAGQRVAAVAAIVRSRPGDDYSVDRLAGLAGMSRATFMRHFARHLGSTPMEYVLNARLQDAAAMLRTTALPVKQIAADAGFQSRSHFSRAFQTAFGLDPTGYRAATIDGGVHSDRHAPPMLG